MKKKVVSLVMCAAMVGTLFAGCGSSGSSSSSSGSSSSSSSASSKSETVSASNTTSSSTTGGTTTSSSFTINPDNMMEGTQFEGLKANSSYSFNIIVKAFQNTYWQAVMSGAQKAADELGVKISSQGPNTESDIADQVNMLNSAINGKPDGVGLSACDASSVLDSLNTAKSDGVPVVAFDTSIDGAPEGTLAATVATDSTGAGGVAGEKMWEAIKDRVTGSKDQSIVGMVAQDATSSNHQQRGTGFINGLIDAATADGVKVAVTGNDYFVGACKDKGDSKSAQLVIECAVPAQSTLDLAATEASAIMNKSNCVGIFGSGQTAAEGIVQANDNLNVLGSDTSKDCIGIGFDSGTILKEKISDGTLYGAITQTPFAMGYYAVCALVKAANGDTVEDMPLPGYFYNKDNLEDSLIAPNLSD